MKSLVEEASSVAKAIEKAWLRAGKPVSFSVKVYEEAQSGFLGFNSKPAKIGLFFDDYQPKASSDPRKKPTSPSSMPHDDQERSEFPRSHAPRPSRPHHSSSDRNEKNVNDRPSSDERPERLHREPREPREQRADRPRSSSDRGDRNDRSGDRNDRNGGGNRRFDRNDRGPRREGPRPERSHTPRKEEFADSTTPSVHIERPKTDTPPVGAPSIQPQQQAPARRILKVSSRRYVAPAKNTSSDNKE